MRYKKNYNQAAAIGYQTLYECHTTKLSYTIEYGKDTIEIQKDIIKEGEKILICDDLLATGGTAKASAKLIEKSGGKISGFAFIIELTDLNGIKGISNYNCLLLF